MTVEWVDSTSSVDDHMKPYDHRKPYAAQNQILRGGLLTGSDVHHPSESSLIPQHFAAFLVLSFYSPFACHACGKALLECRL